MEQKLIAFDLDGTLLTNQKKPLASTLLAIEQLQQQGHFVVIATGRNRFLAQPIMEQTNIHDAVLCNGSAAIVKNQLVYDTPLVATELQHLQQQLAIQKVDLALVGLDATRRLTTYREAWMAEAMQSFGSNTPELDADYFTEHAIYQGLAYYDEGLAFDDRYYEQLDFVRWHPKCVDVIPKGGSKAVTLLEVANQLGLKREQVIAFGDGLNDREMLREVGVGIAMGNAVAEVQRCADLVTASNEADGIWLALEKMNLVKK